MKTIKYNHVRNPLVLHGGGKVRQHVVVHRVGESLATGLVDLTHDEFRARDCEGQGANGHRGSVLLLPETHSTALRGTMPIAGFDHVALPTR